MIFDIKKLRGVEKQEINLEKAQKILEEAKGESRKILKETQEKRRGVLKKARKEANKIVGRQRNKLGKLENRNRQLSEQLEEAKEEIVKLEKLVEPLKLQVDRLKHEFSEKSEEKNREIIVLQKNLEQAKQEQGKLSATNNDLTEIIKTREEEISRLEKTAEARLQSVKEITQKYEKKIDKLRSEMAINITQAEEQYGKRLAALKKEGEEKVTAIERKNVDLEVENGELKAKIDSLGEQLIAKEKEIRKLGKIAETRLQSIKEKEELIDKLRTEVKKKWGKSKGKIIQTISAYLKKQEDQLDELLPKILSLPEIRLEAERIIPEKRITEEISGLKRQAKELRKKIA